MRFEQIMRLKQQAKHKTKIKELVHILLLSAKSFFFPKTFGRQQYFFN